MSVSINPTTELAFSYPTTRTASKPETIEITNLSRGPVSFKIKTTAPKQYCVKPNAGIIEPESHISVQVFLQPGSDRAPDGHVPKDKFLIQTAEIQPEDGALPIAELWQRIESTEPERVHRHKIKCVFLEPKEPIADAVNVTQPSPSGAHHSPAGQARAVPEKPQKAQAQTEPVSPTSQEDGEAVMLSPKATMDDMSKQQLTKALEKANMTIRELRAQLEERGLVGREACRVQDKTNPAGVVEALEAVHRHLAALETRTKNDDGYPLLVVWTAASVTFIIAYLFF